MGVWLDMIWWETFKWNSARNWKFTKLPINIILSSEFLLENETHKIVFDFEIWKVSNPVQKTWPTDIW